MHSRVRALIAVCCVALSTPAAADDPQIPPEIQALMDKLQRTGKLTAAEMKQLQDWGAKMAAGAAATIENDPDADPAAKKQALELLKQAQVGAGKGVTPGADRSAPDLSGATAAMLCATDKKLSAAAPSDKAYGKLLDTIAATYTKKSAGAAADVELALAKATNDAAGATLGAALYVTGNEYSAVLATVWSAKRAPDDATFAANLGAILDGIGDDKAALAVLLRAAKKAPKAVLVHSNLGWVHRAHGNKKAARAAFNVAVTGEPGFPEAETGLGLLDLCDRQYPSAREHFARALARHHSSVSSTGMSEADEQLENEAERAEQRDPNRPPPAPPPPPAPNRLRYPPSLQGLRLIDPPFGATVAVFVENRDAGAALLNRIAKIMPPLAQRSIALQTTLRAKASANKPPARTGNAVRFTPNEARHVSAYDEARRRFLAISGRLQRQFGNAHAGLIQDATRRGTRVQDEEESALRGCGGDADCAQRVRAEYCPRYREIGNFVHASYTPIWGAFWPKWRAAYEEYYGMSNAAIAMTSDADWVAWYSHERKLFLWDTWLNTLPQLETIRGLAAGYYVRNCPAPPSGTAGEVATPDGAPSPCKHPTKGSYKMGVGTPVPGVQAGIEISVDCNETKVEITIGPQSWSMTQSPKNVTLYTGAVVEAGVPGAGVEVKGGAFITFEGMTPVDAGITQSASGYAGTVKHEVGHTVGVASGYSGPSHTEYGGIEVGVDGIGGVGAWTPISAP